jgi:hypothetical protein
MTPQESREIFIESVFQPDDVKKMKTSGMYKDYVEGRISVNTIYRNFKEQGI